jgi:uncharacterized lipoprotein YmbA
MIRVNPSTRRSGALIVPIALLSACSFLSPGKDTSRYAVLASVDELSSGPAAAQETASAARVGLGPVTLPDYVLRPEIVTRRDGTRLEPSATERWAEPFDRAVERVLGIDLERELGAGRIEHHPWYATNRPDVQIQIAFARCEREETGKVVVAARWTVRALAESGTVIERESRIERDAPGREGATTALALSQALAEMCAEIARAAAPLMHAAAPR